MKSWHKVATGIALWEIGWWAWRQRARMRTYVEAKMLAGKLGRPLVVVGAPDGGLTASPATLDDIVIDINQSLHPNALKLDVCKRLPFQDNSCVVFVSCVLEYVDDYAAALRELARISGGCVYVTRVEPWTIASVAYPGAKRTVPATTPDTCWKDVEKATPARLALPAPTPP